MSGWAKKLKKIFCCCCEKEEKPEKEKCKENGRGKEALIEAYKIHTPGFMQNETLYAQYLFHLFGGIAVYVYAFDRYFQREEPLYIIGGSLFLLFLLWSATMISIAFSYQYRLIQINVGALEKELCLSGVFQWKSPEKKYACICKFLPEIPKTFICISLVLSVLSLGFTGCLLTEKWCSIYQNDPLALMITLIFVIFFLITPCCKSCYYKNKINSIIENRSRK